MELNKKMVMMSHLSDAEIEMSVNPELSRQRIEFVKFLINHVPDKVESEWLDEVWYKMYPPKVSSDNDDEFFNKCKGVK